MRLTIVKWRPQLELIMNVFWNGTGVQKGWRIWKRREWKITIIIAAASTTTITTIEKEAEVQMMGRCWERALSLDQPLQTLCCSGGTASDSVVWRSKSRTTRPRFTRPRSESTAEWLELIRTLWINPPPPLQPPVTGILISATAHLRLSHLRLRLHNAFSGNSHLLFLLLVVGGCFTFNIIDSSANPIIKSLL